MSIISTPAEILPHHSDTQINIGRGEDVRYRQHRILLPLARRSTQSVATPDDLASTIKLQLLLVALLTLATATIMFIAREVDDNRLLSWRWTVPAERFWYLLALYALAVAFAYHLRRLPWNKSIFGAAVFGAAFLIGANVWPLPEVIVDSARYFGYAKVIETKGLGYFLSLWGTQINPWTDLPLVPMLYGLVFTMAGEARWAIQALTTLFFALTMLITYLIAKELWDAELGIYAALMLLAMPYLHVHAGQMLADLPSMFIFALALYSTVQAVARGGVWRLALAASIIALALLSKYSLWLTLSAFVFIPFAVPYVAWRIKLLRGAAVASLVFAAVVVVLVLYPGVIVEQFQLLSGFQWEGLKRWDEGYLSTFAYQIHPFVAIAAVYSVWCAVSQKDTRYLVIAAAFVVMLATGTARVRYLVIVMPMLALMAAYGLRHFASLELRKFIVACAVTVSVTTTIFANSYFLGGVSAVNIKNAGEYVNGLEENQLVVIVAPQSNTVVNPEVVAPLLDYYSQKPIAILLRDQAQADSFKAPQWDTALRFTWERLPFSYNRAINLDALPKHAVVLLIAADVDYTPSDYINNLLKNYVIDKVFGRNDTVFRFQTVVKVYRGK